ncbi:MAG: NADP-dependent isocitrate dehydrogenase [Oscillospiraceae bacterium]|jgi:isocitrate dehydrogenase|nr:NADP-dependent isocitrate dehydrogenase [Oscillospiraceae bacterium]
MSSDERIIMRHPIVEMDGDEMTRVLWRKIKETLLAPFVALYTEYYDLGLPERDRTGDVVTREAAEAIKRLGVGVKCATITANAQRVEEYNLKQMWPSPNATLRAALDGTVFRAPITVRNILPTVRTWKKPIVIARHAYGDIYKGVEMRVPGAGAAELAFTDADGVMTTVPIHQFVGAGILQAVYNTDASIEAFARSCFRFALSVGQDLWFAAKDTISKRYDHHFKDTFERVFELEFRDAFTTVGINYYYMLIDDAVARVVRSEGGFVWACKNYDGDVMSDMVSAAFGSLAMMTSVLVSPNGQFEYEAAHGTVTRHYRRFLAGETTSTNPVATIFAWTGALRKSGEIDGNADLVNFANRLELACVDVIEGGQATRDLTPLSVAPMEALSTDEFLAAIKTRLAKA